MVESDSKGSDVTFGVIDAKLEQWKCCEIIGDIHLKLVKFPIDLKVLKQVLILSLIHI